MSSQAAPKLAILNGLRGLAVIGVIIHHSFFDDFKYGEVTSLAEFPIALLMSSGWLGVNLFFFLSGFVLFLPYASGSRSIAGRQGVLDFYRRRFWRIVPLYTLMWAISLVFMSGLQLDSERFYLVALTFITFLFPFHPQTFFPPGNWVMWSIGVEIWFSVLFPLFVYAIQRFGWRPTLFVILLTALTVRIIGKLYVGAEDAPLNFVSDSVLGRMDEFALGMLAAHLYCARRRLSVGWFCLGIALVTVASLVWAAWFRHLVPSVVTAFAVNLLDLGILLCVLHLLFQPSRGLGWLKSNALQLFGMMCYSIYLWHGIVQLRFGSSFHSGVLTYLAYIAAVLVLSFFTYRYIEFGNVRSWRELIPGMGAVPASDGAGSASAGSSAASTVHSDTR